MHFKHWLVWNASERTHLKAQVRFWAYIAGMDSNMDWRAVCFFPLDSFNMDNVLFSVHLNYFSDLLTFEVTSHNLHT